MATVAEDRLIIFDNVSKFYGDVLGVNRVSLTIEPGITRRDTPWIAVATWW